MYHDHYVLTTHGWVDPISDLIHISYTASDILSDDIQQRKGLTG